MNNEKEPKACLSIGKIGSTYIDWREIKHDTMKIGCGVAQNGLLSVAVPVEDTGPLESVG